jgi:predicted MFS family arabinose efflux permease
VHTDGSSTGLDDPADVSFLTPTGRVRPDRARVGVTVAFLTQGLLFASWAAHIPILKARLGLTDADLGTALLGAPAGSVLGLTIAGWLLPRVGSRAMVQVVLVGYCVLGIVVGQSHTLLQLAFALGAWGACQGSLGVAMNTQAVTVERALHRPIMASLHGTWSIGAFTGAAIGAVGVARGVGLSTQVAILGPILLAGTLWVSRWLLTDPPPLPHERATPAATVDGPGDARRSLRATSLNPALLLLGGIAFIGMLGEGAATDWSAVYLRDSLGTSSVIAALAYAVYSGAMVCLRLGSPTLLRRIPTRRLLPGLGLVAAFGMLAALISGSVPLAIVGFGTLGLGVALIVPTCFGAAGRVRGLPTGRAVAIVSGMGWFGFMAGPPLIGHLAGATRLSVALGIVPVLLVVASLTIARAKVFDTTPTGSG